MEGGRGKGRMRYKKLKCYADVQMPHDEYNHYVLKIYTNESKKCLIYSYIR